MTDDIPARSPFEVAAAELRALGIVLMLKPGEYVVNFLNGKDETAAYFETLDEAISVGRDMAKQAPAAAAKTAAAYRGKRPLSMKPKAVIKRRIKEHNRKLRSKAIKELPENGPGVLIANAKTIKSIKELDDNEEKTMSLEEFKDLLN